MQQRIVTWCVLMMHVMSYDIILCSVKPAVLDLVLAIGILVYIGGVYLFVMVRENQRKQN